MGTNTIIVDPAMRQAYNPKSNYNTTFCTREPIQRPGMAVPARVPSKLPPGETMDLITVNKRDFVQKPLDTSRKLHKLAHAIQTPSAPFNGTTSYKSDFVGRAFDPNPMADDLMRTTIPKIVEVQPDKNYTTVNESTLRKWNSNWKPVAYKEFRKGPLFAGKFQGETVTAMDFSTDAVKGGRPSTCYKAKETKTETRKFDGKTINKTVYKLPAVIEKMPLHLKNKSKGQLETMEPIEGDMDLVTQYMKDNPEYRAPLVRRRMCKPHPDKLHLFTGLFDDRSEHKTKYTTANRKGLPFPRVSLKNNQASSAHFAEKEGQFDDSTTMGAHYRPVLGTKIVSGLKEVNSIANRVSFNNKNGQQIKDVYHFGGEFRDKTVNQTEYFQFWETSPRKRFGDSCENVYHPSTAKFEAESVTKSSFPPHRGIPAERLKPLDSRYGKSVPEQGREMVGETAYKSDYIPLVLPKTDLCPAEALLLKT